MPCAIELTMQELTIVLEDSMLQLWLMGTALAFLESLHIGKSFQHVIP